MDERLVLNFSKYVVQPSVGLTEFILQRPVVLLATQVEGGVYLKHLQGVLYISRMRQKSVTLKGYIFIFAIGF